MNHIEARALKWLAKVTGYPESQIRFTNNSSPDFTTPDGQGFEIKYHQRHRCIVLWPRQWTRLIKHPDCSILVFAEDNQPEAIIPIAELQYGTKRWGNIPICYLTRCPGSDKRTVLRENYLQKLGKTRERTKWQSLALFQGGKR